MALKEAVPPVTLKLPLTITLPATSSFACGVVVPIPTYPPILLFGPVSTVIRVISVPFELWTVPMLDLPE